MRLLQGILLPALLAAITSLPNTVSAKKDQPSLTRTEFESEPANLFYFDDSETVLLLEAEKGIVWRTEDAGEKWSRVDDIPEDKEPFFMMKNPYHNEVAVALGKHKTHWITYDQGKSWTEFETEDHPSRATMPITFHAGDHKKLLFSASEACYGFICIGETFYTDDGFKHLHKLRKDRKLCIWAVATELIAEEGDVEENRVICVVEGKYGTHKPSEYRMVYSDDYFKTEVESKIDGQTMTGFASVAAVKKWLVAAAKPENSNELALYTSMDSTTWHKAEFGDHHVEEDAYTLLESTNYSIQVDVQSSQWDSVGVLFSSNSEGRFFTMDVEHTNRNEVGNVDFEKMSNVQGVILVNVVDNWKEVEESFARKSVKTQLSFDDGRTFHSLKYKDKELHLHSVTDMRNSGRIFSSPAPGLIMGVGNTGKYLDDYKKGDLYVSDDGGLNWDLAIEEAHKYEFGDQGAVLVAVYDEGKTKEVRYSLTHGKDEWKTLKLDDEFLAVELTTIPDSTSLRFILIGVEGSGRKQKWVSYTINFEDMHERECGDKDFETWHARVDKDDNALCVMGRKQSYERRKADAECFVKKEFDEPVPDWEVCECSDADFECDFGFSPKWKDDKKECVPTSNLSPPKGECEGDDDTYMGSSGWRKIPGNQCKGGSKKEDKVERKCSDTKKPPASGKITSEVTHFPASKFAEYYYLERCETCEGDDESIVMRTSERIAYITHDHGKNWEEVIDGKEVVAIYPHQYVADGVFFITPSKKVHYSWDRGKTIKDFEAPLPPNTDGLQIMQFHPLSKHKDWIIWTGQEKDDTVAYVTMKGGLKWEPLISAVRKCQFMFSGEGHDVDEKLVYCEQFAHEDPKSPLQLVSSDNWFEDKKVVFEDVVSFATMSEFIVIASRTENRENLKLDASIDGKTFADAKFPPKFTVEHQQAYTVLDSSTHSIFLHVTVNGREDQEYGTIIKSNSNGTSYVLSVNEVNRDGFGYVDFEKMSGLEGVALVNVVANVKEVNGGGMKKKKTLITHNDGADWAYLSPPDKDEDGKYYDCSGDCYLHLHGYTERVDPRATFSSASAVGLMMGVGNVGEYLGRAQDGDTFLTRDGGITWKEVIKGAYMWEYGDQGSIIVIVKKSVPTTVVRYSLDEGDSWLEYTFSSSKWTIDLISTVPSDTSMMFLLWGRDESQDNKIGTVNLDFSGLFEKQCELDDEHPLDGDYTLWSPKHPLQDTDCLFGHIAKYHRKKQGALCFNGRKALDKEHGEREICECSRRDWECDYNYERQSDGSCGLVEGLEASNPADVCKDKDVIEYHEVSGFRKIPISTCEGGVDLQPETLPCPGHEEEYEKKHSASGFVIFLAVVLPIAAAAGIGYFVWKHWDGNFGRIRLGDAGSYGSFDASSPMIAWPVAAVSGLIAVLAALPLLIGSLWRSASGLVGGRGYGSRTYTSRSSFARGRGDYAVVDPDEGELLGDDSDEEV